MASFIELDCPCGARVPIPEAAFEGGGSAHCRACGAEFLFEEEDAAFSEGDFFPDDAAGEFAAPSPKVGPATADPALQCPTCGGQAEVVYRGPRGRDRMLACPYCRTEVDLPEARGVTHERVTERPHEKIVERVTRWEGMEPGPDGNLGGAGTGFQKETRVTEVSSVVTEDFEGGSFERRDRPISPETLAKIRKHFKRKA